jgi:hypothetical protein
MRLRLSKVDKLMILFLENYLNAHPGLFQMWITNGFQADWVCLLANTREGKPHLNKSLIIVPMNEPGVVRVRLFLRLFELILDNKITK